MYVYSRSLSWSWLPACLVTTRGKREERLSVLGASRCNVASSLFFTAIAIIYTHTHLCERERTRVVLYLLSLFLDFPCLTAASVAATEWLAGRQLEKLTGCWPQWRLQQCPCSAPLTLWPKAQPRTLDYADEARARLWAIEMQLLCEAEHYRLCR